MNNYLIQKKIRTPIYPWERAECSSYMIDWFGKPFDYSYEAILITKEVVAENYKEAFKEFIVGLFPILNVMSVITQCIIESTMTTSHLIYRLNDNPERILSFYYAGKRKVVGMAFGEDEIEDITRIIKKWTEAEKIAFLYLREANMAYTATTHLTMLIIAVEALAGEGVTKRKCKTCGAIDSYPSVNKDTLRKILGEELYKKLYDSLRHKLFHGGKVNEGDIVTIGNAVYERVVLGYFAEHYGLKSVKKIVGAPRSFSYEYFGTFVKLQKGESISLKLLEDKHEQIPRIDTPQSY